MKKEHVIITILGCAAVVLIGVAYLVFSGMSINTGEAHTLAQAQQAFDSNNLDGSIAAAQDILARNPGDIQALLAKAAALAQKGSLELKETEYGAQAIAAAQQALALDPNNSEAWRIVGYSYEIMQQYSAAHDAYQKSLAFDPKNVLAISQEAHAYDLEGNVVKAEAGYRAALAIEPGLEQAEMGLGRMLVTKGDAADALPLFLSVSSTSKNARLRAEAAYSAGTVYAAQNNTEKAVTFMTEATNTDPSYALGWTGLGAQLFAQAMDTAAPLSQDQRAAAYTSSLQALQKAISINPEQSVAIYQLGIELAASGDKATALKVLDEALRAVPDDISLNPTEKNSVSITISSAISVIKSH